MKPAELFKLIPFDESIINSVDKMYHQFIGWISIVNETVN
jgi:hypothetical protein